MANGFFLGGMAEGMNTAVEQGLKKDALSQDLALKGAEPSGAGAEERREPCRAR